MASRGVVDMLIFGDSGGTPVDYGGNTIPRCAKTPNGRATT
jgi:hypothetical protein